jgi:hypothetical protein
MVPSAMNVTSARGSPRLARRAAQAARSSAFTRLSHSLVPTGESKGHHFSSFWLQFWLQLDGARVGAGRRLTSGVTTPMFVR